MSRIGAIQTAVPRRRFTQSQIRDAARAVFGDTRHLSIFENAGIRTRHLALPLDRYAESRTFGDRNRDAVDHSLKLAEEAARDLVGGIETLVTVTTTSVATPSLDALLMGRLGMDPSVRRVPLFGVGCAGGAVGLARAAELAAAGPVLLVSSEVCSLTFLPTDRSSTNVVAAALFGDGAAAVRVETHATGPQILKSASRLFPDSQHVMGWDFSEAGMKLVLSTEVPQMVGRHLVPMIRRFVEDRPIHHWILHPGGPRVLETFARELQLSEAQLEPSRSFLERYGNLSSASVLFILRELLPVGRPGEFGLLASVGPGFAGELVLLQW